MTMIRLSLLLKCYIYRLISLELVVVTKKMKASVRRCFGFDLNLSTFIHLLITTVAVACNHPRVAGRRQQEAF